MAKAQGHKVICHYR